MKVSLLRCVYWALVCTQLAGCGDQADPAAPDHAEARDNGPANPTLNDSGDGAAEGSARRIESNEPIAAEAEKRSPQADCPEADDEHPACGQISIKLKGRGSSCQLMPTASDLTRFPRSVRFDCDEIVRGPNGYDFDELGHITLTGDTCEALQAGGPHQVTLVLACGPGMSDG